MRVFVAILLVLTLLIASAAGGLAAYNWLTLTREIADLQRVDDRMAQLHEEQWQRLAEQLRAAEGAQTDRLRQAQGEIVQRLEAVENSRGELSQALLVNGTLFALAEAERAAWLGQSPTSIDNLLATTHSLVQRFPPAVAQSLGNALQRDRQQLQQRPAQNLADLIAQIDLVRRQISDMTAVETSVRSEPPPPKEEAENAGWLQQLLALLRQSFRLEKVAVRQVLAPSAYEYQLIRVGLEGHLAQVRLGLLMRDQGVWDAAWQNLLTDTAQWLNEDEAALRDLQHEMVRIAAIEIGHRPFEFRETRQVLEAARR